MDQILEKVKAAVLGSVRIKHFAITHIRGQKELSERHELAGHSIDRQFITYHGRFVI
jgi:hypothetical protein